MDPSILLLAEDEPLIALTLEDALEEAGFAVLHVKTAEDAIQAIDSRTSELSGVITDIKFGTRIDGWAIARHARELVPHIPIVYMSGDSAHDHTAQGVPDSIMIQKPFAAAQLITAVSTLLNALPPSQPT
ncbi:MAG TPA: response regulator [Allosphingosinicella sp.]|nr:response regulator [Allosphingosinicella sp.]